MLRMLNPRLWTDEFRAAVMLLLTNVMTVLVLFGILNWTDDQIAGVEALINSGTIVVFYLLRGGTST